MLKRRLAIPKLTFTKGWKLDHGNSWKLEQLPNRDGKSAEAFRNHKCCVNCDKLENVTKQCDLFHQSKSLYSDPLTKIFSEAKGRDFCQTVKKKFLKCSGYL